MRETLAFFLALAAAAPVHATVWTYAPARIDEVVVDTSTPVPATRFQRLWSSTATFRDFRYPNLTSDEVVTVIANDFIKNNQPPDDLHGIYRFWPDGRFETIAARKMPVPGLRQEFINYILSLQTREKTVSFYASTLTGLDALMALYGGKLRTIAHTGQETSLGVFRKIKYGVPWGRQIVFTARLEDTHAAQTRDAALVYDFETRDLFPLFTTSTPVPGRERTHRFSMLLFTPMFIKGEAYLRAVIVPQAENDDPLFPEHRGLYKLTSQRADGLLKRGEFKMEKVFDSLDDSSLARRSREHLSTRNSGGQDGQQNAGSLKTPLDLYAVAASEKTWALVCETADYAKHLLYNSEEGVALLADSDTAIPDLFEGTIQYIHPYLQVHDEFIYFLARAKEFYGIFAYDSILDRLYLVVDGREKIEGKTVRRFEHGFNAVHKNRLVFTAIFTDGSAGIYLGTLPEKYFVKARNGPAQPVLRN